MCKAEQRSNQSMKPTAPLRCNFTTRAKKRAVVAVARKPCVLLLSLWKNQTPLSALPCVMQTIEDRKIWNDCDASLGSVLLHNFANQMATFQHFALIWI
jgi:hypothetical protein